MSLRWMHAWLLQDVPLTQMYVWGVLAFGGVVFWGGGGCLGWLCKVWVLYGCRASVKVLFECVGVVWCMMYGVYSMYVCTIV